MLFNHADYQVMCNKIEALWQEQWFKDAVLAKWNTLYGDSKTTDLLASLTAKIDALATEIAQTQADNYATKANGGAGWTLDGDYSSVVQAIKDYLNQRFVYLDTKFKELTANEAYEMGDVNMDGSVDVTDVVIVIDYVLDSTDASAEYGVLTYGDMNSDSSVDISDVVAIVNKILGVNT
jgi:hypothetical protein